MIQVTTAGPPVAQPPQTPYEPPAVASDDIWKVTRPKADDPKEMEVCAELRRRMLDWEAADGEWKRNAMYELDFLDNHWVEESSGDRKDLYLQSVGRAAFHIDLLTPAIDLIVNAARLDKITARFIPLSEGANEKTAEIRQGLYRNIDRESKGSIARETAYQFAVSVGRGYYRVGIEDEDGPSFQRKIVFKRVDNLNSIAIDTTCLQFDYEDAEWGAAIDHLSKDKFRASMELSKDDPLYTSMDVMGLGLPEQDRLLWFPKDNVRVVEYFRRVWTRRLAVKLISGEEMWEKDLQPHQKNQVIREKWKTDYTIEWRLMTGAQTIEKRVWPGRYIPIVVCIGREVFRGKKGKIHRGMVRPAIAPVLMHDVMFSRLMDEVGLAPLPHFLAYTGQLTPEQKGIVNTINQKPWSTVEISAERDADGRPLPLLGWVSPSPNTAAVVQAAELASQKLDRVLNTFAPNRGQAIADQSGRAIREIKDSGDVSHAAFPDNLRRAVEMEGRIVNDLMDKTYTEKQMITIGNADDSTTLVAVNQPTTDPKTGKPIMHIFGGDAKYGIAITTAPKFPSRQAEAAEKLLELAKQFPNQVAQVLDLLVRDLGLPNAEKYAERMRPPGVSGDDGPDQNEMRQQIQQLGEVNQQGHEIIEKLLEKVKELGDERFMQQLELESRERIAAQSDRTTLIAAELKAGQGVETMAVKARLDAILKTMDHEHALAQAEQDHQHASAIAAQGADHQSNLQQQQADQQQDLQDSQQPEEPAETGAPKK